MLSGTSHMQRVGLHKLTISWEISPAESTSCLQDKILDTAQAFHLLVLYDWVQTGEQ